MMETKEKFPSQAKQVQAAQLCRNYFESGFYCAESVLQAVAQANGRSVDGLAPLMSGLCGGMARSGGLCGALLGAIASFGLLFGRRKAEDDKRLVYSLTYRFNEVFKAEFGSRFCHGVLPCDIASIEGAEVFSREGLAMTRCLEVSEKAAALAQECIEKSEELDHPFL